MGDVLKGWRRLINSLSACMNWVLVETDSGAILLGGAGQQITVTASANKLVFQAEGVTYEVPKDKRGVNGYTLSKSVRHHVINKAFGPNWTPPIITDYSPSTLRARICKRIAEKAPN
jgi:hypothetical protein